MNIHIALYKWKEAVTPEQINQTLRDVEALATKVPGIIDIAVGENTSKYSEGYTHVILVRGEDQAAIDAYRNHPDHAKVATAIEAMEDRGVGVDFSAELSYD
jgi:heme-degrading monooxygenase HmoA